MNKKIKEATKQEIKDIYQSNIISLISQLRYRSRNGYFNMYDGELINRVGFTLGEATKINKGLEFRCYVSNKQRSFRLSKRMRNMILTGKALFLTLTFNDTFLNRDTTAITRRRYVARFLKEQCLTYVANKDFGEDDRYTKREHYHALVVPKGDIIDFQPYRDAFDNSAINVKRVKKNEASTRSISLYINKLTRHSLKSVGKYERLIYSRA